MQLRRPSGVPSRLDCLSASKPPRGRSGLVHTAGTGRPKLSFRARLLLGAGAVLVLTVLAILVAVIIRRFDLNAEGITPTNLDEYLVEVVQPDGTVDSVRLADLDITPLLPSPIPEDGQPRIALLGGSVVGSMGDAVANALIEAGTPGHLHVQGIRGCVTGTTVQIASRYLADWAPDVVVVYHAANDIILMSRFPEFTPFSDLENQHRAWVAVRRHYEQMLELTESMGAQLVLATFPGPRPDRGAAADIARLDEQISGDLYWLGGLATYRSALDSYTEMVRAFAEERSIPLIDVAALSTCDAACFLDEAHVTVEAEAQHARILAEGLAPLLHGLHRTERPTP